MRFQDKLRNCPREEIWAEYCGFLDLSMADYMTIQHRLLQEQLGLWSASALGQRILGACTPTTVAEFRAMVPLTQYSDYAELLLQKRADTLPAEPVLWIQTTWEGGVQPLKVAPYTRSMLQTYKRNMLACFLLATSQRRGHFDIAVTDHMLYALAPLPYATGLLPLLMADELDIEFLPPVREAEQMSFKERNKKGFQLGLHKGIEYFFGLGSVTYFVSKSLTSLAGDKSAQSLWKQAAALSPQMLLRYLAAKRRCKKEGRALLPKDLFQLKGFMCAGTDNNCYKDDLEALWGIRPMEIFAGTEPTCIGTETWSRNGMYFFPDACFYEFIPEAEMDKNSTEPDYVPRTVLMDEVVVGEKYEIVLSVLKGGAFARYRVGDTYRCTGLGSHEDQTLLPRFSYVDRVPWVIDIAGFTRITQGSIETAIHLSRLRVADWFAAKEYSGGKRPFLHLYVELERATLPSSAVSAQILREHLAVYFKYIDQDYRDLQKILEIDPLNITIVKCGSFAAYARRNGQGLRKMNPPAHLVSDFLSLQMQQEPFLKGGSLHGEL